jgi:hypothetical protein
VLVRVKERGLPRSLPKPCYLRLTLTQVLEAFLQRGDLAQPDSFACFGEPGLSVRSHVVEPSGLCRVHLEESASCAGVLVDARGAVGAVAVAEGDLAQEEVLLELVPLLAGGWSHLAVRAGLPASFDESVVRLDHVLGKDGGVAARGLQVQVAEQGGDDVERQARPRSSPRSSATTRQPSNATPSQTPTAATSRRAADTHQLIGRETVMNRIRFTFTVGNIEILVLEREAEPGVFDVGFSPEPTTGPSGFTIAFLGSPPATVSRKFLEQEVRKTIAGYGPGELSWTE